MANLRFDGRYFCLEWFGIWYVIMYFNSLTYPDARQFLLGYIKVYIKIIYIGESDCTITSIQILA
ncbi:hypothetical protein D3C86_2115450 [compost metagenome]